MEPSRRDLESLVTSQKDKLTRYETRLKDVVTAYKGLLKEKEALEASLSALSVKEASTKESHVDSTKPQNSDDTKPPPDTSDNLQVQIATLMNSLATLSAEKSRMESSFQADKKQIRQELSQKDKTIVELKEKLKDSGKQNSANVESIKSKLIVERHEREKESNNHMVMIRELQKLYADERHLKENIEMQLNNLKAQFAATDNSGGSKMKQLATELMEANQKIKQLEARKEQGSYPENGNILQQLQNEMHHLKQQHAIAIKTEQKRAHMAEERSKKLAALHEDRVANLEARLAELSTTVGTYDRLRQQDQDSIQKLKDKIIQLASNTPDVVVETEKNPQTVDISLAVDEIVRLKKLIVLENARTANPVDINKIFNVGSDHTQCLEDINRIQIESDATKRENDDLKQAVDVQKTHIRTLQEKVKVLNRNIEEQELELKLQGDKLNQTLKVEKSKWKDALSSLENEFRSKLNDMEQQLQKQRVRSLQLLDEKENEIKTLKTSFEVFVPQQFVNEKSDDEATYQKQLRRSSSHLQSVLNMPPVPNGNSSMNVGDNCHMIHYASELARKDVEVTVLRKAKYSAETALRQALQDKVTSQEELCDKIASLEDQVDRLERCKTREGANLEYLKNVIISFISTKSIEGKIHMINAIGAVLQFTPNETKAINSLFHKK